MARHKLERLFTKFSAWYRFTRAWILLQSIVLGGLVLFALYVVADKLVYFQLDYSLVGLSLGCLGLLTLLVGYLVMARRTSEASYLVDRNAGLKNLVGSGLEVQGRGDSVSRLIVQRAAQALSAQNLKRVLPFKLTWAGRYSFIPLLVGLGLIFVPHLDLLKRKAARDRRVLEQARQKQSVKLLEVKLATIEKHHKTIQSIHGKNITDDLKKLRQELIQAPGKKEALVKLNSLAKRYRDEFNQQRNFEAATRSLSTQLESQDLDPLSRDTLKDLMQHLRQNDLEKAAADFRDLARQMGGKELKAGEKQALARELNKIMQQLQGGQTAGDLAKLLNQMQCAPMAGDKLATAKPGQNRPPQPQGPGAGPRGNKLGRPGGQGQMGLSDEELAQMGQRGAAMMGQMADMLAQMDALAQMKEGLENARQGLLGEEFAGFDAQDVESYLEEESRACLGMGSCPSGKPGKGDGTGGPGQGRGGKPPEAPTATTFKEKFSDSSISKGKILNQLSVYGVPEKGVALQEYSTEVRAARERAISSLAKTRVPRECEEMVKKYFSSITPQEKEDE